MIKTPLAAAVTLVILAAGCTGASDDDSPPTGDASRRTVPAYAETDCPRDVAIAMVGEVTCGTLTVPENRADGTGKVRLLASTLVPPGQIEETPVLVLGLDTALNYSGIAPLAQRTRSTVILLEPRGTSHSLPSLACEPEEPPVTWTDRTGSKSWQRAISTWAEDCAKSLTAQGVDVGAYGADETAEDAVDLMDALDVPQANLITYGSGSRVALEVMRSHSDRLRAVVLDTPELSGIDHRRLAEGSTHAALQQVLAWCDDDIDCRRRYPHPTTLLERALTAAQTHPQTLKTHAVTGPDPVVLDAAMLVRLARRSITDGGSSGPWALPTRLPALLTAVIEGRQDQLNEAAAELLGAQGPLCPGYRPKCSPAHKVTEGTAATVLCGDVATSTSKPPARVDLPGFREAYYGAWWWSLCDSWPVSPGRSRGPVTADVPTLVLTGGLADIPVDVVRKQLDGLENSSVVVVPTGAHNVLGDDCTLELRNKWLRDLQPVTATVPCIDERLEW